MSTKVQTLNFSNRVSWRRWLRTNHKRRREVWLILPKKSAGGQSYRIYYNQALEEAICYGWIDSRIRPLDETRSLVRFTPRKNRTSWSHYNLERARELIRKKRMTRAGLKLMPPEVLQAH